MAASDAWIVKIAEDGGVLWQKAAGGDRGETARAAAATPSGGVLIAGQTGSGTIHGSWFAELDGDGNYVRQHVLEGACWTTVLRPVPGGGFVSAGLGDTGACVMLLWPDGQLRWGRKFTEGDGSQDQFYGVLGAADGSVVAVGESEAPDNYGAWAVRFNGSGDLIWQKLYSKEPAVPFRLRAALGVEADGMWLAGEGGSDNVPYLLQTTLEGEISNCPVVSNASRRATAFATNTIPTTLGIRDVEGIIQEIGVEATPISIATEFLCPLGRAHYKNCS